MLQYVTTLKICAYKLTVFMHLQNPHMWVVTSISCTACSVPEMCFLLFNISLCLLLQGSWWKRSMAEPQHQLSESHSYIFLSYSVFTITVPHVLFHLGSLLSTDSLFIFISRQLRGKCPVMDSCSTTGQKLPVMRWYLTGMLPSIDALSAHCSSFLSLLRPSGSSRGRRPTRNSHHA